MNHRHGCTDGQMDKRADACAHVHPEIEIAQEFIKILRFTSYFLYNDSEKIWYYDTL